jgi:hypothetical protein
MIRIMLTDEQGTLLSAVTLDHTDLNSKGKLDPCYIGGRILEELPSNQDALAKLLGKPNQEDN